jgi:L-asparagine transporter-like permease
LREIAKDMNERYDLIFNTTIKVLAIIVLIIAGVTLLNLNGIASNGRDVSNEAKDDGKLILKEVTESAVEALRERRERN